MKSGSALGAEGEGGNPALLNSSLRTPRTKVQPAPHAAAAAQLGVCAYCATHSAVPEKLVVDGAPTAVQRPG